MRRLFFIWIFPTILFAACRPTASSIGTEGPAILTSTTFLADMTRNVAGDRLTVESLLPLGSDPHNYQPSPRDVTRVADSRLLIVNGGEYEHFLASLLNNAGGEREVIVASAGVSWREDVEGGQNIDPHMWLDPNNVIIYVENIREALTHFDPEGAAIYQANADAYIAQLKDLDTWINEQVSQIPQDKRLLVTNHESLGYFADRYDFIVTGTVIQSFSSGASPSAGQMADLIDQIKAGGAPAIFLDASDSNTLAQQIADETGVRVVTDLHLESLTDGPPAGTYIEMMKYNVTLIVQALR